MKRKAALTIILILSIAGLLFSGYLSYGELLSPGAAQLSCASDGSCNAIAGVPVCIYGFIMYLLVFIFSIIGLNSKK